MSSMQHTFISITAGMAQALIIEMQAVLDGEASYFHAELWTEDGRQVGLHMSGPEDAIGDGGLHDE